MLITASLQPWRYIPLPRPTRPAVFNFYIQHGRHKKSDEMDDWGFDGPTLKNCIGTHTTYLNNLYVIFTDMAAAKVAQEQTGWEMWDDDRLLAHIVDDMLLVAGDYYGDWGLIAP